jgi:hypothetical protein
METMNRRKFGQLMAASVAALSSSVSFSKNSTDGSPDCANPEHPEGAPKKMLLMGIVDNTQVFGCRSCWDVNRVKSVRVVTDPEYQRWVRSKLAKQGKLLTGLPPMLSAKWVRRRRIGGGYEYYGVD